MPGCWPTPTGAPNCDSWPVRATNSSPTPRAVAVLLGWLDRQKHAHPVSST